MPTLQELVHLPDALRAAGQTGWQELSGVGERLRSYGASAGAELAAELAALEGAVHDALAAALQVKWPVSRWPIYVFTGGVLWAAGWGRSRQRLAGPLCGGRSSSTCRWVAATAKRLPCLPAW